MSSQEPLAILGVVHPLGRAMIRAVLDHPGFCIGSFIEFGGAENLKTLYLQHSSLLEGLPEEILDLPVHRIEKIRTVRESCRLVISALEPRAAALWEPAYAKHGLGVVSSSQVLIRDADVPVVDPYVNPHHLDVVELQRKKRGFSGGFLMGSASLMARCAMTPLQPLHQELGVLSADFTFLAGIEAIAPRLAAPVISNIVPRTKELSEDLNVEMCKMLGFIEKDGIGGEELRPSNVILQIPASESIWCESILEFDAELPTGGELADLLRDYSSMSQEADCARIPENLLRYVAQTDRPQSRLELESQKDGAVVFGQLHTLGNKKLRMSSCLSGSAPSRARSVLQLAGLCLSQGLLPQG